MPIEPMEPKEMSRGAMTAWIVGTLVVMGLGIALYFGTRMDASERDAECQQLIGMDEDCVYENAIRRLRGW